MTDFIEMFNRLGTISACARELGCDRKTFREKLRKQQANTPAAEPQACSEAAEDGPELVLDAVEAKAKKKAATDARKTISALCDEVLSLRKSSELLAMLDAQPECVAPWNIGRKEKTASTAILFTSDFQAGEVIKGSEIDNANHYDLQTFRARYDLLIERTCEEIDAHSAPIEGLYYLRGGDAISGGIHAELKDTDEGSPIECVQYVADVEIAGITHLADKYGRVHVVSIPGNHGRIMGPWGLGNRCKGYAAHNLETLLALLISKHFKNDDRVTFFTPESGDAEFTVYGHRFLMIHGDRMKGSGGINGISNGHRKTREQFAATGYPIDYMLSGHYHTSVTFPGGFGNGSLAGWGEYAKSIGALPDAAKQWLMFVTPRDGVSKALELVVSPKPRRTRIA